MKAKSIVGSLSLLVCLTLCVAAAQAQWTPEEQMKVKAVSGVQVSPDGKHVLFTVSEAVMTADKSEYLTQIWMANSDGSGSYQFTFGEKSSTNPRWSPDGTWIAFTSSRSGKDNIWLIQADGGEAQQLTDVKSGVRSYDWSPDGKQIAFTMSDPKTEQEEKDEKARNDARVVDENVKMNHLWVIPVVRDDKGKREPRQVTKGQFCVGGGDAAFDWSPDGKTIVFSHVPTLKADDWTRADISIIDVATSAITPLVKTGAAETDPRFSPDGKLISCVVSDDPPTWGFTRRVVLIPAQGGESRTLAATFDGQPGTIGWSADGKWIYATETRHTFTQLMALPVDGGPPKDLSTGDSVFSASLNRSRTAFGLSAQSNTDAPEAFITPADRWAPVLVSKANAAGPNHPLGRTEVVKWQAADGLDIEGLLTYPVGYERGRRYPMPLVIHGGPAGVFTQAYIASRGTYPIATFAAQGWAVLRCNIRGSSGYGKQFRYANYKDWGGMDYRDLMAGVDHVIGMGVADPERLGVMGWSYGGFMTSWIITQTKRFKAASIGAPVTNLMSFNGTTDIPSFVPDYFGVEFWNDLDPYLQHSAMFNIKNAATPSLIQHGESDERVPIGQGYELYNALKRQGTAARMVVYPRQPHGLQEPRLVLDAARRNVEWFQQYLGK
jgi:dipeptidyl aminopeptidase/acylaminoacyl peptidase